MKKLSLPLIAFTMLVSLTQCNNPAPEQLSADANARGKIISTLMNNDAYMTEVMDSIRTKHPDAVLSAAFTIVRNDTQMQKTMIDTMMSICKDDSEMCKMMMGKAMDMCDSDNDKCCMMMGAMKDHPKGMMSMKDMGMCDMKGMDMENKKEEHSQHHK